MNSKEYINIKLNDVKQPNRFSTHITLQIESFPQDLHQEIEDQNVEKSFSADDLVVLNKGIRELFPKKGDETFMKVRRSWSLPPEEILFRELLEMDAPAPFDISVANPEYTQLTNLKPIYSYPKVTNSFPSNDIEQSSQPLLANKQHSAIPTTSRGKVAYKKNKFFTNKSIYEIQSRKLPNPPSTGNETVLKNNIITRKVPEVDLKFVEDFQEEQKGCFGKFLDCFACCVTECNI